MTEPAVIRLRFMDLYAEVADYLGYGRSPTGTNATEVKRLVNEAYRDFLSGRDPRGGLHRWSFMEAVGSTGGSAGDFDIGMTADFADMVSDIGYTAGSGLGPLRSIPAYYIRQQMGYNSTRGRPTHYAVESLSGWTVTGQRWQFLLYPIPDAEYTYHYRYRPIAEDLTGDTDYARGGGEHSQTLLQMCLAAAERRKNDGQTAHQELAEKALALSIDNDNRRMGL